MGKRILRAAAVAQRFGYSIRTLYREVEDGHVPPPITIAERVKGWTEDTVDQVIADREAGQRSTPAIASTKRKRGRPRKLPPQDKTTPTGREPSRS